LEKTNDTSACAIKHLRLQENVESTGLYNVKKT